MADRKLFDREALPDHLGQGPLRLRADEGQQCQNGVCIEAVNEALAVDIGALQVKRINLLFDGCEFGDLRFIHYIR